MKLVIYHLRLGSRHSPRQLIGKFCPWMILSCLLGLVAIPASQAYFQDLGMGARPAGMGEAFTAVADDSNTMFWNAAGLAELAKREVNLMYSDLYSNLNARLYTGEKDTLGFNNVGLVVPFNEAIGSFGLTWTLFNSKIYRENIFLLGYGREIGTDLFNWLQASKAVRQIRLCAGLNLKVLNWQVEANEFTRVNPVFQQKGLGRTGITADMGLLMEWIRNVKFGFSLENFIPYDMGLTTYETVPLNPRLGVAYLHEGRDQLSPWDSLLGALDFTYRNNLADLRAGLEACFFKHLIAVRMGTTIDQFTTGLSIQAMLPASPIDLRLDYAFNYPYGIKETWGSHRVSLVIRWGEKMYRARQMEEEEENEDEEEEEEIEGEANLANQQEQTLNTERVQDEARLQALLEKMQQEIQAVQLALEEIKEQIRLEKLPSIQFASGQAILKQGSFPTLDQIGETLQRHPQIKVRIEGHTDSVGQAKANKKLSQQRVEAVKEYLVGKHKLNPLNLIPIGYGATRPIASNQTPEGRAANRRVEMMVILPAGMNDYPPAAPRTTATPDEKSAQEILPPPEAVTYEEIEKLREKLKVYEMQMDQDEVEEMLEEQHRINGEVGK